MHKREREAEGEKENLKQAPHSAWNMTRGLIPPPWDHDLRENQESDTQVTEPPRSSPKPTFKMILLGDDLGEELLIIKMNHKMEITSRDKQVHHA